MQRKVLYDKYNVQRQHAKRRGIEWQFESYEQWIEWWGEDIEKRGSRAGQLVMARYNDEGPYHPDNVRKLTVEENTQEARKNGRGFFQSHTEESKAKIAQGMKEVRAVKQW